MRLGEYCPDCERSNWFHIHQWIERVFSALSVSSQPLPYWLDDAGNKLLLRLLCAVGLGRLRDDFSYDEIAPRAALFVREARQRGIVCSILQVGSTYTEHVVLEYLGKRYYFQSYPTGAHTNGPRAWTVHDKIATKRHLAEGGFPITQGQPYGFWQGRRALKETPLAIGYPLVVKPRHGTYSRHVTTRIHDDNALGRAINHSLAYQPSFIVERYLSGASVHRMTIIDFKLIAVAIQSRPHVVGNGTDPVSVLLARENGLRAKYADPMRQVMRISGFDTQGRKRIPRENEIVYSTDDPFVRNGATVRDSTETIAPENRELAESIARYFDIKCAGIDIMLEDVSITWKGQRSAVLEINDLPSIEMHGTEGAGSRAVPAALVDLFIKYYAY